jgi:cytochrome c
MPEVSSPTRVAAGVLLAVAGLSPVLGRAADPAGEQAFAQCAACHSTDGSNGVGPTLKGIVGRASASVPGFAYSSAMKHAQLQWTPEQLDKYIANPQAAIPGNVMPYAGMTDAGQRAALIAYLSTLK